ncbi:enoyl-CoA hydratase/isomerase family protein [Jannaschia seohaensis]|uniref:Enoyl-CoA hydratase/carnithine racemase n=1 Tax=Jannaschia seohaensis TaxID=475081 RepID=A0A2Y9A2A4_9RHOB|nr:enoyl-CoA hydratase/isomerase family protein [Jannaschia seohaensis]PWJ22256.1 enoyl-CoA hydratase/carnithine racemase [Jannaschia seohaensis]SSA38534.1 Enoyl-CoA hydratase/carnithine racemase [Jannaschia seohaensis]
MIRADRDGAVTVLTIDRPDKANSLTGEMLETLGDHVLGLGPETGLLILTGAGDKVFSAGADLEEARAGLATSPLWERLSGAIAATPCLTVAALNGTLAGGAFGMALACDIRLAVPQASFFYPVAKLGFLPQPSDPARLAALIGPARAKLILAAGARLDASEALAYGLIERIVPDPLAAARALAVGAPEHVAAIKAMVP